MKKIIWILYFSLIFLLLAVNCFGQTKYFCTGIDIWLSDSAIETSRDFAKLCQVQGYCMACWDILQHVSFSPPERDITLEELTKLIYAGVSAERTDRSLPGFYYVQKILEKKFPYRVDCAKHAMNRLIERYIVRRGKESMQVTIGACMINTRPKFQP
jgi:hypothetical protein